MKQALYAVIYLAICYSAFKNQADKDAALREYIEKSKDPETRQQAQIDYFGHDVESPSDLFDRIREEAWHKRDTLVPRSPANNDPVVDALSSAYVRHMREQYFAERSERRQARD